LVFVVQTQTDSDTRKSVDMSLQEICSENLQSCT